MLATNAVVVTVLICLVTLGAAEPPRPQISETFDSYGNAEIHREKTSFGKFRISWDPASKQGMQNMSTVSTSEVTIIAEELYKEDEGLVYYLRISGDEVSCAREKAPGVLPLYWGWLKYANYTGTETLKHVVYDQWQFHVAGVDFEVLVGQDTPNRPFQYIVTESHSQTKYEFLNFTATTPPESVFVKPSTC